MGILDRVTSLFRRPPAPLQLAARAESAGGVFTVGEMLASASGSSRLSRRSDQAVLDAFGRNPWLHIVVKRRAEAVGSLRWRLWRRKKGRRGQALARLRGELARLGERARAEHLAAIVSAGELEELFEHPVLDIMDSPSPSSGISGPAFWQLVSSWLDLVGTAPVTLERPAASALPEELSPIVPTWIMRFPEPGRAEYEIQRGARSIKVPARDMILMRNLNPLDPFGKGLGTARVLADEIELDEYMAATAKSRFFNRALPDMILSLLGPNGTAPSPGSVDRLKTEIENQHSGVDRAGRFHVVGGEVKPHDLGHTFQETQYVQGRRLNRDTTVQGFGTPPEVVGVLENSNKGTIHAAAEHFARYSTVPTAEIIRASLQEGLVDEYGEDLELDYYSPIPSDAEDEQKIMIALPSAFTVNEIRKRGGLEARADGDVYMKAPGAPSIPIAGGPPKKVEPAPAPKKGTEPPEPPEPEESDDA